MIRLINLQNFKCFEEQRVSLSPLTVLSGLNGMGKSTVVQSLLLLRQSYMQRLLVDTGLALNGELVKIGTGQDALYQNAVIEQGDTIEKIGLAIHCDNNISGQWYFKYEKDADILPLHTNIVGTDSLFQMPIFSDKFYYLSAERIGPRPSYNVSNSKVREHRQIGIRGEFAVDFLATFGEEKVINEKVLNQEATSNSLENQVDAWVSNISPGTRVNVKKHPDMDLASLRYQFLAGRERTNLFRSTNVGFGLTYTLPVIVALLSATPGTLIILENPESHLHPRGQSKMGELIALACASGIQVIVETHSDHILNGIRLAVRKNQISPQDISLHYFHKQVLEDKVLHELETINIYKNGRLSHWPDGFFDEWDRSLDALLD